jgi:hypothetical protein
MGAQVMTAVDSVASLNEPLTASGAVSRACLNPFCKASGVVGSRRDSRYCSSQCRLDAYVLRRAGRMIAEVGLIEFSRRAVP